MRKFGKFGSITAAALVIVVLGTACSSKKGTGTSGTGGFSGTPLTGAGATFPAPIYSKWFHDFLSVESKAQINYQAIGSGGGIQQHTAKTVQFGASDGILTDAQKTAAPNTLMIPTVAGSEAVVVNLPGITRGQLHLTPTTLAGLYLGDIKKWNDARLKADNLSVSLPDLDVIVATSCAGQN